MSVNLHPKGSEGVKEMTPAPENIADLVRASMAQTLHRIGRSRDQVALGMAARLGVAITKSQIDCWTADSRQGHRFPLEYLPAWCRETGDYSLLKLICEELGLAVPEPGASDLLAFAKARLAAELSAQEAEGLKARILRGKGAGL